MATGDEDDRWQLEMKIIGEKWGVRMSDIYGITPLGASLCVNDMNILLQATCQALN